MENVKMICFDMDGTIANLYGVKNWEKKLRNNDPTPYKVAKPMWDMNELREVLIALHNQGIEIRVITWLAMDSTEAYKRIVRQTKIEWLTKVGFPIDHFHAQAYGTTKANAVRKDLGENETAILIDDNAKVRKGWRLGETIDPTTENIIEVLKALL
jgi:hypothetical protein